MEDIAVASENIEIRNEQGHVSVDKINEVPDAIKQDDKLDGYVNGVNSPTKDNIDELDIESIHISQDDNVNMGVRSSVVIHEDVQGDDIDIDVLNTQSLDDLECDPVAMIDLDSEDNGILVTSDTDKMNSIRTDTTFDDESTTPKASTFHMMSNFPVIIIKDFGYPSDRQEFLGIYPKLADSEDEMEYDESPKYKKAVALYDFEAENPSELSFKEGDTLTIKNQPYEGWFMAELRGESGLIPENYIQKTDDDEDV